MTARGQTRSRGDDGQMLLLTAIILAIGFIALASMAARIDQIPERAELVQEDSVFDEVTLVVDGVAEAMDQLAAEADNMTFETKLEGALAHLALVEGGRGYYVTTGPIGCAFSAGTSTVTVPVAIASTTDEITMTVSRDYAVDLCS